VDNSWIANSRTRQLMDQTTRTLVNSWMMLLTEKDTIFCRLFFLIISIINFTHTVQILSKIYIANVAKYLQKDNSYVGSSIRELTSPQVVQSATCPSPWAD